MTSFRRSGDAGQAFPIYITVVGGLLFLALAYFAVGQAAANRNDAQTAADAAALAAAQDTRDALADRWVQDLLDPAKWQAVFDGNVDGIGSTCGRAYELAARNDASVIGCGLEGLLGYKVEVETNRTVGDSVVPGTENRRSNATATAVIEPRCTFQLPAEGVEEDVLPPLTCEGEEWELDPKGPIELLPRPEDLFEVHLAD
ncbi:pilus assembly protein TadG-related protein [Streptomyces sp. NPDC051740]|uniref:pilus assembly protein TadG-related protein n=1 Tax=Streptomyces sp. NPDC051740 TaxID=3365673 RepID=UPI0037AF05E3